MKALLKRAKALFVIGLSIVSSLLISGTFLSPDAAIAAPMKNEAGEIAKKYERTAKEAIDEKGPQSMERIQERQAGGLNEIQGTAGIEDMKTPENSNTDSIEQDLKKGLDKVADAAKKPVESVKDAVR